MDDEFVILAIVFLFIGVAGVLLFTGPKTPAGDSCVCVIPSPEAGAMQGTSGILLIFGILFLPVGLLKGGPPSFRRRTAPAQHVGKVFTPVPFESPSVYTAGVLAVFVSVFLVIPAIFVLRSPILLLLGVVLAVVGSYLLYAGTRVKPQKSPDA